MWKKNGRPSCRTVGFPDLLYTFPAARFEGRDIFRGSFPSYRQYENHARFLTRSKEELIRRLERRVAVIMRGTNEGNKGETFAFIGRLLLAANAATTRRQTRVRDADPLACFARMQIKRKQIKGFVVRARLLFASLPPFPRSSS